jgi:signal transduction histidine kinase
MRPSLQQLFQTTTFRLGVVQAVVVLAFVVLLLSYVFFATTGQLLAEAEAAADTELTALERAYSEGGIRRLTENVESRRTRRTDLIYSVRQANGELLAGEPLNLTAPVGGDRERVQFRFTRSSEEGGGRQTIRARGAQARLLGGPVLVVASDLTLTDRISERLTRALVLVAGLGIILAVASGLFAARQAARRAETLSQTTREVMKGDLSVRAPVRGAGDEFDQLALDLNAMLGRLERLVIATRSAGDAIAHDLRTPLTRQRQRIEAALSKPPETHQDRGALQAALEESNRLLTTFQAVLRLARVESASNWKLVDFDISALVADLFELYQPAAEDQGLSLELATAEPIIIVGEATLLQQALSNLIENALKYNEPGGKVRIGVRRRNADEMELTVSDDGLGVPPEDRERVVRRFERLDRSRQSEGHGLGLSLVDAVARLHRGRMIMQDGQFGGPGRPGLSVTLVLPLTPQKAAA